MKAYPLVYIVLSPDNIICGVYDTEEKALIKRATLHREYPPTCLADAFFLMIEEVH